MQSYFIGVDDTDAGDSIGTGAFARELMVRLEQRLAARSLGITRHQFLIHPNIPYTSHNSGACLELQTAAVPGDLAEAVREFISDLFHAGADPGFCLTRDGDDWTPLAAYGRRAQVEVVDRQEAVALARAVNVVLEERGGDGLGIVGALSSVGLRMSGEDGRFISLHGIRTQPESVTVAALLGSTPIDRVLDPQGRVLAPDVVIETRRWVRPELRGGRIVLPVVPVEPPEGTPVASASNRYRVAGKKPPKRHAKGPS